MFNIKKLPALVITSEKSSPLNKGTQLNFKDPLKYKGKMGYKDIK